MINEEALQLERLYTITSDVMVGRNTAAKIMGGRVKLMNAIRTNKVHVETGRTATSQWRIPLSECLRNSKRRIK